MLAVKEHKNDHVLWSLMLDAMDEKIWTVVNVDKNASGAGCSSARRRNPRNMAANNHFCHKHHPLKTSYTSVKMRGQKRREIRILQTREDPPQMTCCSPQLQLIEGPKWTIHKAVLWTSERWFSVRCLQNVFGLLHFVKTHLSSHQSLNLWPALCYNYNTTSSTRNKHDTNKNLKIKGRGKGHEGLNV